MASGRVTVRLNRRGIAAVTHRRLLRVGQSVLNASARRVNVDTGNLRSTRALEDKGTFVRVAYRARYARAVHDGSRPHVITAINAKVLSTGRGGQVFGRTVNHPGYRGNPYLTGAVREVLARYGRRRSS